MTSTVGGRSFVSAYNCRLCKLAAYLHPSKHCIGSRTTRVLAEPLLRASFSSLKNPPLPPAPHPV